MIVCSTLHIGGAERVAATIAQNLRSSSYQVQFCCLKENGVVGESVRACGIRLTDLSCHRPGSIDRLTSFKLLRLLHRERIDVVHTHDVHGLIDASICRRLHRGIRHLHTFHFGNYPNRDRSSRRAEQIFWRSADTLVAVGHAQAAAIRSLYAIPEGRLRVVWNGVEDTPATQNYGISRMLLDGPRPIILSVSTLIEQKGILYLLQAARLLKEDGLAFRIAIAGHGHLRDPLEQQAKSLGVDDRISFLGWVSEAAQRILPACDIFVQTSLWEAMSIVVLEAMAAARPMVVTQVGENPHVVQDGESGIVVPPADPRALADALARILRDPALAASLGGAARRRYLQKFTTQPMLDAYESIYRELADSI